MKIFLVNPPQKEIYGKIQPPDHPHLGLLYVATTLEQDDNEVVLIDFDADNINVKKFQELLQKEKPDIVGFTATTPTYKTALDIAEIVKNNSNAKTILGGIHATLMPHECMQSKFFDFLVKGEGEITAKELVKALKNQSDLETIEGILYRKGDKIIETPDREFVKNLDLLPFPSVKLLANKKYNYPDALKYPAFPIITSRGCPGKCSFCTAKFAHGTRFRFRSPQNVVDEIEILVKQYGAKEIHIWDDNFITIPKRVFQIRDEIIKRKIKCLFAFPNGVRADFIREDVLLAMKEMGTYSIAIGVESGNQRILDNIGKGITLEQVRNAFSLAKKLRFEIWAFFLIGLPGEDEKTIRETIDLAIELDPDIAKFHILKPYPKTKVSEELKKLGLLIDENYIHYGIHTRPVHRLEKLSQIDLEYLQKEAYRKFYLRPNKLLKEIIRLKTVNRAFLNIRAALSILKEKIF